jgi:hypothetical protein
VRDPKLVARVSGYSMSQEYHLDWETHTAMFCQEVCTEAHSLSMPTTSARRDDRTLTLLGSEPGVRGVTFTIIGTTGVGATEKRYALGSGWVQKQENPT